MDLEEKISVAVKVIEDALSRKETAFAVSTGDTASLVLLHLIKAAAGTGAVKVINMQFLPMEPARLAFMEKLGRLWGLKPHVERLANGPYTKERMSRETAGAVLRLGGQGYLSPEIGPAQGEGPSSGVSGITGLRPLSAFFSEDIIRYIDRHRLPVCSLDLGNVKGAADEEKETMEKLKSLGYL